MPHEIKLRKKKGFNIDLMLSSLSKARTVNHDGTLSLSGFGVLEEFESYLRSSIEIDGKTDAFVRKVVKKAMHAKQDLTEGEFIKHCKRSAVKAIEKDQRDFRVLFPVWGSQKLLSGRRWWGDVSITFDIQRSSRFAQRAMKDRAEQLAAHENSSHDIPGNIQNLPLAMCSVKGIDVFDAFEQAESAISKELGLYSLTSSRGKFIFPTNSDRPINTIMLAPHMTVHDKSGAISTSIFWYNRWPKNFSSKKRTAQEIDAIITNSEKVRSRLKRLPWRAEAEAALVRHYLAFAQCDLESSFLDGWRLLEAIAGHNREKSETLIRRASWFFEDTVENYQVGLHLMERRNLISHGRAIKESDNEGLAFQMKKFLTPFLHAFLMNPFDLSSLEEFWAFCDLPVNKEQRARQAYLLSSASKFRREE
ncbi:MAG: hypothetical protein GVY31_07025 [Alphaproteobacteria bacterium]|jgi:hypothetical protein|nr:hypothetical protein [Alphaproteobacteria bacterium]